MLPLIIIVRLHVSALMVADRIDSRLARLRDERGQTSAEYALVLLGAATIALLIALWAKNTNKLGELLDRIFDTVTGMVR
ncbi:MAG: Flp family type IVb pilin [Acidimicrobiales bacterium]